VVANTRRAPSSLNPLSISAFYPSVAYPLPQSERRSR
jgi:hypothetical protein